MNTNQKRSVQAFQRVADWLVGHPVIAALVAPFLTGLNTVLAALSDAAVRQDSHLRLGKGTTAEANEVRRALIREHMRLIARVALTSIPDVVKVTAALQRPKDGLDNEGVYTAALAMAAAADENKDALIQGGLDPQEITLMRDDAAKYKTAINARDQFIGRRRGATKAVDVQLVKARRLVDSMDVLVARALRSDPATLAEWEQVKRVRHKGVQAKGAVVANEPGQVPTPDSPVAAPAEATPPVVQASGNPSKTA